MAGVTPLPAESRSSSAGGSGRQVNLPDGPEAQVAKPGRTWSCSQLETRPPGTRLTLISSTAGRVGVDEIE